MRKPFWTKEELEAQREADRKNEIWFRRGCGCLGTGCPPLVFSCLLPLILFVS